MDEKQDGVTVETGSLPKPKRARVVGQRGAKADKSDRVRIMLEESDDIPPTGQFFGLNGKGYILRPGEEADVPVGLLNVLDSAIYSVPIMGDGQRVIGYKDRLRFPYRIIQK